MFGGIIRSVLLTLCAVQSATARREFAQSVGEGFEYNKRLQGRKAAVQCDHWQKRRDACTIQGLRFHGYAIKEFAMDCTRRGFVSRFGLFFAEVSGVVPWGNPAGWARPTFPLAAQHDEHSKQPMTTHASGSEENKLTDAEDVWAKLMAGNARFVAGKPIKRDVVARRGALLGGQHPPVVVLGCSDSRVTPSVIFDQALA